MPSSTHNASSSSSSSSATTHLGVVLEQARDALNHALQIQQLDKNTLQVDDNCKDGARVDSASNKCGTSTKHQDEDPDDLAAAFFLRQEQKKQQDETHKWELDAWAQLIVKRNQRTSKDDGSGQYSINTTDDAHSSTLDGMSRLLESSTGVVRDHATAATSTSPTNTTERNTKGIHSLDRQKRRQQLVDDLLKKHVTSEST